MHPDDPGPPGGDPRLWARAIGPETFDALKKLAFDSESAATKLGAIKEILDRGYGRTPLAANAAEEIPFDTKRESTCQTDPSKAMPDPSRR